MSDKVIQLVPEDRLLRQCKKIEGYNFEEGHPARREIFELTISCTSRFLPGVLDEVCLALVPDNQGPLKLQESGQFWVAKIDAWTNGRVLHVRTRQPMITQYMGGERHPPDQSGFYLWRMRTAVFSPRIPALTRIAQAQQ